MRCVRERTNDEVWGLNDLAIAAPVPESQTYALMLAGPGVLSVVARRRKSATR